LGDKSYLQLKVISRRLFPGNEKSEYEDLFFDTRALIKRYFNRANNTWYVKIVVKTPKGIIPVSEVIFNSKGDMIDDVL